MVANRGSNPPQSIDVAGMKTGLRNRWGGGLPRPLLIAINQLIDNCFVFVSNDLVCLLVNVLAGFCSSHMRPDGSGPYGRDCMMGGAGVNVKKSPAPVWCKRNFFGSMF
jgi:hypothetical protein